MKVRLIVIILVLNLLFSCDNAIKKSRSRNAVSETLKKETAKSNNQLEPLLGYRFIIKGDFDGDGRDEKLIEHYFSGLNHKETNKFYGNLQDYDELVELTIQKEPSSFVVSDNKSIDTLHISSSQQQFGVLYLKNEGDLNGDGTDEVSYVINWADWSNLNTWYIVTYKNKKWRELYSFPIWDWQLPDLPGTTNQYGLFGLENKVINKTNDSINKRLEKELNSFEGLVKKIKMNKIQVIFRNEDAEKDTLIVDLKRQKKDR